ncbi:MAG: type II and III secretion system protein [Bacteroidota bacterium]|nr:type II and III secretion system protein [Bacteroidota bacterium]
MKRIIFLLMIVFLLGHITSAQNNREKRLMLNEYVSPEELVSMSKSLQFDKAVLLFSDFSKKYMNKIIVDVSNNKKPIGVDIENMYWYQAFENVLRTNGLWYDEREEFFYVYSTADSQKTIITSSGAVISAGSTSTAKVDTTGRMLLHQRDIRISTVFFDVNVTKSLETGINWNYSGSDTTKSNFGAQFSSGIKAPTATSTTPGFFVNFAPKLSFANLSALASFFSQYNLGDILSGPSLVVSSGKQGKIQVGKDFFITQRDFAGNSILTPVSSGIIIDVKPTVYEENGIKFINLEIKAENSSANSDLSINKSTAATFSVLYDGEETVIGGLYKNNQTTVRSGIPFLKDLPWWVFGLRYIFGFESENTTTTELIILIKADIIPTIEERVATAAQKKGINLIEQARQHNASEIERLNPKK